MEYVHLTKSYWDPRIVNLDGQYYITHAADVTNGATCQIGLFKIDGNIEGSHMWLSGDWKYLYFAEDGAELLFKLEGDPHETENLAASNPEQCARMRGELIAELARVEHPHLVDGKLLSQQMEKRPVKELLAENPLGWACTTMAAC